MARRRPELTTTKLVEPKLVRDHAPDVVRVVPGGGLPTSTWGGLRNCWESSSAIMHRTWCALTTTKIVEPKRAETDARTRPASSGPRKAPARVSPEDIEGTDPAHPQRGQRGPSAKIGEPKLAERGHALGDPVRGHGHGDQQEGRR